MVFVLYHMQYKQKSHKSLASQTGRCIRFASWIDSPLPDRRQSTTKSYPISFSSIYWPYTLCSCYPNERRYLANRRKLTSPATVIQLRKFYCPPYFAKWNLRFNSAYQKMTEECNGETNSQDNAISTWPSSPTSESLLSHCRSLWGHQKHGPDKPSH